MIHSDPASSPEPTPTNAEVIATAHDGPSQVSPMPKAGRLAATAILAGLAAGLISWTIGEAIVTLFRPPYFAQHVMGQTIMKATFKDQSAADIKNATLTFAVLGGALGAALGMAGGLARSSTRAGAIASVIGLALGGVLGAGTSLALLPVYFNALGRDQEELSRDLALPLLVHAVIWAACGLAGGVALAFGLGAGRTRTINAAIGGLIGAVLGAALYEMMAAALFPHDNTTSPLPINWMARLLARLLVATLSGLMAALVMNMSARRPAKLSQMQ